MENLMENFLGTEDFPWVDFFEENIQTREVQNTATTITFLEKSKDEIENAKSFGGTDNGDTNRPEIPVVSALGKVHVVLGTEDKLQTDRNFRRDIAEKLKDEEQVLGISIDARLSKDVKVFGEHPPNESEIKEDNGAKEKSFTNTNKNTDANERTSLTDIDMDTGMYIPNLDMIAKVNINEVKQQESYRIVENFKSKIAANECAENDIYIVLSADKLLRDNLRILLASEDDDKSCGTAVDIKTSQFIIEEQTEKVSEIDRIRMKAFSDMNAETAGMTTDAVQPPNGKIDCPNSSTKTIDCYHKWRDMLDTAVEDVLCNARRHNLNKCENFVDRRDRSRTNHKIEKGDALDKRNEILDITNKVASSNISIAYSYLEWKDMLDTAIAGMYNLKENTGTESTDNLDNAEKVSRSTNKPKAEGVDTCEDWKRMICNAVEVGLYNSRTDLDRQSTDDLVAQESEVYGEHVEHKKASNNEDECSLSEKMEKSNLEENIGITPRSSSENLNNLEEIFTKMSTVTAYHRTLEPSSSLFDEFGNINNKKWTDRILHDIENKKPYLIGSSMGVQKKLLKLRERIVADEKLSATPSTEYRLLLIGCRAITLLNWITPANGHVRRGRLFIFFPNKNNLGVISLPGMHLKIQYHTQQIRIQPYMRCSQGPSISNKLPMKGTIFHLCNNAEPVDDMFKVY